MEPHNGVSHPCSLMSEIYNECSRPLQNFVEDRLLDSMFNLRLEYDFSFLEVEIVKAVDSHPI